MGDGHTVEGVKLPQLVRGDHGLKLYDIAFAQCNGAAGVFVKFHRLVIQEKSDAVTCSGCAAQGKSQGNGSGDPQVVIGDAAVTGERIIESAVQRVHAHTIPAVFGKLVFHILRCDLFLPHFALRKDFPDRRKV